MWGGRSDGWARDRWVNRWAQYNCTHCYTNIYLFYTELGTEPNLETLTLFVSPPTAVSLGGGRAYKKG